MIQQISRWQGLSGLVNPSERWTGWARSLTERHGRIPLRHGVLTMILFQPLARLYFHCQRWQNHAGKLSPQIHLAIAPILPSRFWKDQSVLPLDYVGRMDRRIPVSSGQARSQAGDRVIFLGSIGSNLDQSALNNREIGGKNRVPLHQVFSRANGINEELQVNQSSLLVEESLRILRRVASERQRVEERMAMTPIARQLLQPSKDYLPATTENESQPETKTGARTWQQTTTAAINLDQLTEQVIRQLDHRLIAYRERMGKLF